MAIYHGAPTFTEEKQLRDDGYTLVAGVDEVGRGALVGPVVAAAVILPSNARAHWYGRVRESKQLNATAREYLFDRIRAIAIATGIGACSNEVIDSCGIAEATRRAMKLAVEQLSPQPQYLLIDFLRLPEVNIPQKGIKFGDSLCFSIACASIIAKVTRDCLMEELDGTYPGYGLSRHKGYATKEHLESLRKNGPCAIHRRSFQPVYEVMGRVR